MSEHVHRCLSCRPDMVPDFDRDDPRYHHGEKCVHRIKQVLVDGVDIGFTAGAFEGSEGWVLFAGGTTADVHGCSCNVRNVLDEMDPMQVRAPYVCVEPRFGVVTVEHMPPVLIDAAEVIHRLPKGWPGPNATPAAQATFNEGWETFWYWLHKEARQWS